jgi:hypothetical protein
MGNICDCQNASKGIDLSAYHFFSSIVPVSLKFPLTLCYAVEQEYTPIETIELPVQPKGRPAEKAKTDNYQSIIDNASRYFQTFGEYSHFRKTNKSYLFFLLIVKQTAIL